MYFATTTRLEMLFAALGGLSLSVCGLWKG